MIKILENFDSDTLIQFYKQIEPELIWKEGIKEKKSGIQFKKNEDHFLSATEKVHNKIQEFKNLNPLYKNTIVEELIEKYKLFRTRWLWLFPMSCYSIHTDFGPRIHIPLITNKSCLFIFPPNNIYHLEKNYVYLADTTKQHTFINASEQPRLHLVGCL